MQTVKALKSASNQLVKARRTLVSENSNKANAIHRIALLQAELCSLIADLTAP